MKNSEYSAAEVSGPSRMLPLTPGFSRGWQGRWTTLAPFTGLIDPRLANATGETPVVRRISDARVNRAVHEWLWPCGTAFQAVDTGKMPVPRMHEDTPNRELL